MVELQTTSTRESSSDWTRAFSSCGAFSLCGGYPLSDEWEIETATTKNNEASSTTTTSTSTSTTKSRSRDSPLAPPSKPRSALSIIKEQSSIATVSSSTSTSSSSPPMMDDEREVGNTISTDLVLDEEKEDATAVKVLESTGERDSPQNDDVSCERDSPPQDNDDNAKDRVVITMDESSMNKLENETLLENNDDDEGTSSNNNSKDRVLIAQDANDDDMVIMQEKDIIDDINDRVMLVTEEVRSDESSIQKTNRDMVIDNDVVITDKEANDSKEENAQAEKCVNQSPTNATTTTTTSSGNSFDDIDCIPILEIQSTLSKTDEVLKQGDETNPLQSQSKTEETKETEDTIDINESKTNVNTTSCIVKQDKMQHMQLDPDLSMAVQAFFIINYLVMLVVSSGS